MAVTELAHAFFDDRTMRDLTLVGVWIGRNIVRCPRVRKRSRHVGDGAVFLDRRTDLMAVINDTNRFQPPCEQTIALTSG